MIGPGKYDDVATAAREATGARDGVLMLVFSGRLGHGFSAQLSPEALERVPKILREVADQVERDLEQMKNQPGDPKSTGPAEVVHPIADGD